jgi:HPt (histidine-containing phosphotransfer) domain-containing protein
MSTASKVSAMSGIENGAPVFDVAGTLRRLGGDLFLLSDLIRFYDEDSVGLLNELRLAVQSESGEKIRRTAHALRGLAANIGASALCEKLLQLEQAEEQHQHEELPQLVEQVQQKASDLHTVLDPYRR